MEISRSSSVAWTWWWGRRGAWWILVTRRSLPLEGIEAVVLDEADEMLDMGFREDLERLLGQAAGRRLTLMFSATLPPDILHLAARYQKNAARIDTRQGGATPHADIHYVAYLTPMGEKLAAVMNILRVREARRAIVFGTTRDGVASLHESLVQRGVRAVVLSGDRSQADRDRALAALKRGEARVLVATNVAARGLDLPEVDLVIHADLPSNVEALTHRSGRTGRAGRKGTSVLLAQVSERRKAERLMAAAKLRVPWLGAPDAEAVAMHAEEALCRELRRRLDAAGSNAAAGTVPDDAEASAAGEAAADAAATSSPTPRRGWRRCWNDWARWTSAGCCARCWRVRSRVCRWAIVCRPSRCPPKTIATGCAAIPPTIGAPVSRRAR